MTISEVYEAKLFSSCTVSGLLQNKTLRTAGNNRTYLVVRIADAESSIEFPVWDNIDERNSRLTLGQVVEFSGQIGEYQGQRQINVKEISILDPEQVDMSRYIARYNLETPLFDYFNQVLDEMAEPYASFVRQATGQFYACANPTSDKEKRWNRFIRGVAASKHHQNKQGGLFLHTVGVLKNVENMIGLYTPRDGLFAPYMDAGSIINPDRLRAKAILHDICKVDEYEFEKGIYRRSDIVVDHRISFLAFADKVNEELKGIPEMPFLSDEELLNIKQGILTHHGPWGAAKPKTIEDTLLHMADAIDAKVAGCAEAGNETHGIDFSLISMISAAERL